METTPDGPATLAAAHLAAVVTRHVLHAFASPLSAIGMQLEMGDADAARRAVAEMAELLAWLRAAVGGKELAADEFARLTAARVVHRPVEVVFAPGADWRAMRAAALLLPVVAGRVGGRGPAVARAEGNSFAVEIADPARPADPALADALTGALTGALFGAVSADSALAPAALAAGIAGPLGLEWNEARVRVAGACV